MSLKRLTLLIILVIITCAITGCSKTKVPEKIVTFEETPARILKGYDYNEKKDRYVNEITGNWYVVKNGLIIIPSEQYIDRKSITGTNNIAIENRPNDVWELSEVQEVIIKSGETLAEIINPYFTNIHFRMDSEWYTKQVLELNNIIEPNFIREGDNLKLPIYIDIGSKLN